MMVDSLSKAATLCELFCTYTNVLWMLHLLRLRNQAHLRTVKNKIAELERAVSTFRPIGAAGKSEPESRAYCLAEKWVKPAVER